MLLEKSPSARPRGNVPQAPPAFAASRTYPPMVWSHPGLGRSLAEGLGGIGRAMGAAVLVVAALISAGMVIALVLTTVVRIFGIDASSGY
ncbi:hypothetical protein [Actinoplanes sp. NPDC020271]|uniref:hypothetical protein n=1 Tax=Actinoplanes sp. NPDC020271 TaxID=3363896 RepID=UPI00378728E0